MSFCSSISESSGVPAVGLTDQEEGLAQEIIACLESENCEDIALARTRLSCLKDLGAVISRFPSIRESKMARGEAWDEKKLAEYLTGLSHPFRLLHSPDRAAAIRSYLAAKFHAFSLLATLAKDKAEYRLRARHVVFTVIYTLIIEDVYFSCLEDAAFPGPIRARLAGDLTALWDSGADPRSCEHLPALEALWVARRAAPPSFGTMEGSSELARITTDLGDDWHSFLVDSISHDETRFALEEFLFGISYEEILELRSRLKRFGISAVGFDEVRACLGSQSAYTAANNKDLRFAYDFYVDRRDAAQLRRRANAAGPKKTLGEIYLKRLIRLTSSK
jgi:hypothetical protein